MEVSRVNLSQFRYQEYMDLYEWIGFVAMGFIPTLVGLEITWRIVIKRLKSSTAATRSPEVVEGKKKAAVIEGYLHK
jgi:hypothetical protein